MLSEHDERENRFLPDDDDVQDWVSRENSLNQHGSRGGIIAIINHVLLAGVACLGKSLRAATEAATTVRSCK
jgi:hypothetical protein